MSESPICKNCNRLIDDHTQAELLTCKIEIGRNSVSELTDEDITNLFNEIKSGEYSRMTQKEERSTE